MPKRKYNLLEAIDKIYPYIKKHGRDEIIICIALLQLGNHHGIGASSFLCRFADHAIENNKNDSYIASTIEHDLCGFKSLTLTRLGRGHRPRPAANT